MRQSKWSWPVPAAARRAPAPTGAKPATPAEPDADPWAAFEMSEEDAERIGLAPARENGSPAAHARWLIVHKPLTAFEEWENARIYLERTHDGGVPAWERTAMEEFFVELSDHFELHGGYWGFYARYSL